MAALGRGGGGWEEVGAGAAAAAVCDLVVGLDLPAEHSGFQAVDFPKFSLCLCSTALLFERAF